MRNARKDRNRSAPQSGDRTGWFAATTLQDLAEQTARWLEGTSTYLPTYLAPAPDPETEPLVGVLAQMNRLGLMTDSSQPGSPLENGSGQRAAVTGWCSTQVARKIITGTLGTDLVVMVDGPGATGTPVVVTISKNIEYTWFGRFADPDEVVAIWGGDLHPKSLAALLDAMTVTVIDPVWGRNDLLWPALVVALQTPDV